MVKITDFEMKEEPIPELKEGEVLIKNQFISFDPTQRGWMNEGGNYMPGIHLGEVMRSMTAGHVIESKNPFWKKGDIAAGLMGWQEYVVLDAENRTTNFTSFKMPVNKVPSPISIENSLGLCGIVGFTAYFGLLRIGEVKEGDVVVVSGAAGATGGFVGQIAKIKGASKVIGIAGGAEKCKVVKEEYLFDDVIDYKSENVHQRIKDLCPSGINVFYDNVGGEILEAGLANLAMRARVVICGGISNYNSSEHKGPKNYLVLIGKRARMEGFLVTDYAKEFPAAAMELNKWHAEGKLKTRYDIQHGFENIPQTFLRIFTGANVGKQLLEL